MKNARCLILTKHVYRLLSVPHSPFVAFLDKITLFLFILSFLNFRLNYTKSPLSLGFVTD